MKKRIVALLLCAALLLPCMAMSAQPASDNLNDDSVARRLTAVVYCLTGDMYRLVPDVRTVDILVGETPLEVLAGEVLRVPQNDQLTSAMSDRVRLHLLSVVQTGSVATVDIGGEAEMLEPYEIFCLKAAMVNTLVETGLVEYVNVLFEGREVPTNDLPTGTMTRFDEDLQSAWIEHENEGVAALRSSEYTFKRNVTLYFSSMDSDLLLAEVRQITFTRSSLALPVIDALITGPLYDTTLRRSYPSAATVLGIPYMQAEDQYTNFWEIDFSYEMGKAFIDQEQRRMQFAPLVMTLTTFLPQTDAIRIRVNHRPIEGLAGAELKDRLLYRAQFSGMLGRTVELYYPMEGGRQIKLTRAVLQKENTLRDLLCQLMIVPEGVTSVFPEGFTAEHLRGVTHVDDIAVVNLTQQGAELLRGLSADEERACVFCIVNTLTASSGVSRVQFLVEGYKVDQLGGAVSLRSPLVRNPGIIRTTMD